MTAEGPAGPLTRPARRSGRDDAWHSVVGWHIAFGLIVAIGALWALTGTGVSSRRRLAELGLLTVLTLAYLLLRPSTEGTRPWRSTGYLAVAVAVVALGCALDPAQSILLFLVYPQVWRFTGDTRAGIVWSATLTLASSAGFLTAAGWNLDALRSIGPITLAGLLSSLLLGLWISRIIDQSKDRAELIEQLESTRSELAEAHHAQGVAAERERLAREIHDTLAQGFTSIVMLAQAGMPAGESAQDRLEAIEEVARDNLAEARALVAAFTPIELDGSTLTDAVQRLVKRFGAQTGLQVVVLVDGDLAGLDRDREVVLLRAVQEALANVRRHAQASAVTVRLVADGGGARVEVADDGVGFAPGHASGGYGLTGMRSRVNDVGGDVTVTSAPGRGTRVVVRVAAG